MNAGEILSNLFKNYRVWLVFAVILAVLAAAVSIYVVQLHTGVVRVVAVRQDIRAGEVLSPQSLTFVDWPRGAVTPDTLRSPQAAAGMAARGFIPEGTVLHSRMLVPFQQAGMAGSLAALGEEYVAVAVPNTLATTVGGVLESGNRIDVYAKPSEKALVPEKIASDVLVLRAGTVQTPQGEQQAPGVVLALSPGDLERLLPHLTDGKEASLLFVLKPLKGGE